MREKVDRPGVPFIRFWLGVECSALSTMDARMKKMVGYPRVVASVLSEVICIPVDVIEDFGSGAQGDPHERSGLSKIDLLSVPVDKGGPSP